MRKLMTWFWVLLALVGAAYSQTGWYPVVYKYGTSSPSDYVVLNSETGALMWTGHNASNQSFAVNRDSMFVYALENDTVVCRNDSTGDLLFKASFGDPAQHISVVFRGDSLLTYRQSSGGDSVIYKYPYDLSSVDSIKYHFSDGSLVQSRTLLISPDCDSVIITDADFYVIKAPFEHLNEIDVGVNSRRIELGYHNAAYIDYNWDKGLISMNYDGDGTAVVDSLLDSVYVASSNGYHSFGVVADSPYVIVSLAIIDGSNKLEMFNYGDTVTVGYTGVYSDRIYSICTGSDTAIYAGSAGSATTYVRKFSTAEPWGSAESPVWSYTASTTAYYYTGGDPTGYWHKKFFSGISSAPSGGGKTKAKQRRRLKWVF